MGSCQLVEARDAGSVSPISPQQLRRRMTDECLFKRRLGFSRFNPQAAQTGIEREREEAKEQLENWLRDVPDTFIVVTGPRGSGKTALVDEVLAEGK